MCKRSVPDVVRYGNSRLLTKIKYLDNKSSNETFHHHTPDAGLRVAHADRCPPTQRTCHARSALGPEYPATHLSWKTHHPLPGLHGPASAAATTADRAGETATPSTTVRDVGKRLSGRV